MNVQQLKSSKILVIGDACLDVYHFGNCTRLSPEAPVPIFQLLRKEERRGMAANVVDNLKGLNNKVDVVVNEQKIYKNRYIDEKTKQHLLRIDEGDAEPVKHITEEMINNMQFSEYDALVISDYNKGFLSQREINILLEKATCPIFVDSKKSDLSMLKNCFVKINKSEYKKLKKKPNFGNLIVTLGKDGAWWETEDKYFKTEQTEIFDVCGAGDTFLAAFVTAYLSCENIEKSIIFANKCAAISVKHLGTYVLKRSDLVDLCI